MARILCSDCGILSENSSNASNSAGNHSSGASNSTDITDSSFKSDDVIKQQLLKSLQAHCSSTGKMSNLQKVLELIDLQPNHDFQANAPRPAVPPEPPNTAMPQHALSDTYQFNERVLLEKGVYYTLGCRKGIFKGLVGTRCPASTLQVITKQLGRFD